MSGKGDTRRPSSLTQAEWDERWRKVFGKAARSFQETWNRAEAPWVSPDNQETPESPIVVAREISIKDTK